MHRLLVTRLSAGVLPLCLALTACGSTPDPTSDATGSETAAVASEALTVGNRSVSNDFLDLQYLPAGVAADSKVIFIGSPLEGRVLAYSRLTGKAIGELPAPPNGFVLPFIMHSLGEGRVGVLDAGGLPQPKPFVASHPMISEYTYHYDPASGFSATLARFVDSTGTLIGFPEDFVKLPDGRILLTDAILGALWVIQPDGTFTPGIVPKSNDPSDGIPQLMLCPTMPEVTVNGVPFLFSGSTNPGIESITARDGVAYFHSPCARGLFKFPISILSDQRAPYQRAADIRLVGATPANIQVEELLDMQFNPYDSTDPYLYAAHGLQLEVLRVDPRNGARVVLAQDAKLFDFPSSLAFLPPLLNDPIGPNLVVVSNQQERTPLTNDAVTSDSFVFPIEVAKVHVLSF